MIAYGQILSRRAMLTGASFLALTTPHMVLAQDAQTTTQGTPAREQGDIIVTARKTSESVLSVPITIDVVTQQDLDDQSIRTQEDLSRITPSLVISNGSGSGGSNVYMRGIASAVGAPTVGIYLDDIQLQRRSQSSAFNGNGSTFPQFFDLERVEVLKGPQGTLYGGSSIGGTVRFVLPTPSLTDMKVRAKLETATTRNGDPSFEAGAMVSVPLIEGELGLLTSVYGRRLGGYIDHVSRFDGRVLDDNTNAQDSYSGRVALLWEPDDTFSVKPAVYYMRDVTHDADNYWTNIPSYTLPGYTVPASQTVSGSPLVVPAYTFPERNVFGPYRTGNNCNVGENNAAMVRECVDLDRRESELLIPSLTISADLGFAEVTSITSYTYDKTSGTRNNAFQDMGLLNVSSTNQPGYTGLASTWFNPRIRLYRDPFIFDNVRKGVTQELRVATDSTKPLSLVGGLYYSRFKTSTYGNWEGNLDDLLLDIYGRTVTSFYGVDSFPTLGTYFYRANKQTETEYAAFGELTFSLTDRLKLIAGARIARVEFSYYEETAGATVRRAVATRTNGGITDGTIKENPFSPKLGLQYFIDDRNMVYATASKGFRAGGISPRPIGAACDAELAGLNFPNVPAVPFQSDSVWSYEIGAKLRPFGGALTLEASAYRIDWNNTQVTYRLNCNGTYIANAGSARSQGFDLQATVRPTDWLTLNGALSHVDAKYGALSLGSVRFINEGDAAPVPKWSYTLGAQVRAPAPYGLGEGYLRFDYQYSGGFPRIFGPGTNGFFPDIYKAEATRFASARAGFDMGRVDLSVFVQNVFNSQDDTSTATNMGRGSCAVNASGAVTTCGRNSYFLTPTTFRPRTVGISARYQY